MEIIMKKKFIAYLLLLGIAAQMIVCAEPLGLTPVYSTDFSHCVIDRVPDERWVVRKNDCDKIGAIMYRDGRVLKIAKGDAGDISDTGTVLYLPNTISGRAVITMEVMAADTSVNFAPMYVLGSDGKTLVCCTFNNKAQIGVYYNNAWNYQAEYAAGRWYTLTADIDLDGHTFDFYVDGVPVAENVGTRSTCGQAAAISTYVNTANSTVYAGKITVEGAQLGDEPEIKDGSAQKPAEPIDNSDSVVVFEDDFEGHPTGAYTGILGSWTVETENDGTTEIAETDDGKIARISKGDEKGMQSLTYRADIATARALGNSVVTLEYKIRNDNAQRFVGGPYILSRTLTPGLTVGLGNAGYAYANNAANSIGNYRQGQWLKIKLVMDYPNKVYDVYVDGEPVRLGEAFRSSNSMDLLYIRFYVEAAGAMCSIDDFRLLTTNKDMPEPADEVAELEERVSGGGGYYTVTREYVASYAAVKPPVVIDTPGYDSERFLFKAAAVDFLAEKKQEVTIRSDDTRVTIPYEVFEGVKGSGDITLSFDKNVDAKEFESRLPGSDIKSAAAAYRLSISSTDGVPDKLAGGISVKQSGVFSGEPDRCVAVVNLSGGCEYTVSKNDILSGGIFFITDRSGEFLAVRTERTFGDVGEDYWAAEYIKQAAARGIFGGFADGSFRPELSLTRGEAAVITAKALGFCGAEYRGCFDDIDAAQWYAPYVEQLYERGILPHEVFGTSFCADEPILRGEMAYMAAAAYCSVRGRENKELTKFFRDTDLSDLSGVGEEIADSIKAAYVLDLMNGNDGKFEPERALTRAQAAKVELALLEALQYIDKPMGIEKMQLTDLYTFPFTYKSYYEYIPDTKLANMNEDGAYGLNVKYEAGESDRWYLEEQRNIDDDIVPEIVRKKYLGNDSGDAQLVEKLMKAVEYGFSKQDETGGFDGSYDEYHEAGFFLEEVGRILLLMRESGDSSYQKYLDAYTDKLHKAMQWFTGDEEFYGFYDKGYYDIYTHRYFYYGAAMLYAYKLTGDEAVMQRAHSLLLEGISRMTKEGVLPEKYGFDIGYGVVSIHCALRCMFAADDPMLKSELYRVATKSSEYIINKLDNKGNIDVSDSTRVGQETKHDGTLKTVSERSFYNVLLGISAVTGLGDMVKAMRQMAVRQDYIPAHVIDNLDKIDMVYNTMNVPDVPSDGSGNVRLTELAVRGYKVSSEYGDSGRPDAMFENDGNLNGWYTRKLPQYVDIDLGVEREIGRVDTVFGDTGEKRYFYSVMVSDDGENWRYAVKNTATKRVAVNSAAFDTVRGRYVRIWISKITPMFKKYWFTDLRGVKIYGIDDGQSLDFEPINGGYLGKVEY